VVSRRGLGPFRLLTDDDGPPSPIGVPCDRPDNDDDDDAYEDDAVACGVGKTEYGVRTGAEKVWSHDKDRLGGSVGRLGMSKQESKLPSKYVSKARSSTDTVAGVTGSPSSRIPMSMHPNRPGEENVLEVCGVDVTCATALDDDDGRREWWAEERLLAVDDAPWF
jgi:hypothetical protein